MPLPILPIIPTVIVGVAGTVGICLWADSKIKPTQTYRVFRPREGRLHFWAEHEGNHIEQRGNRQVIVDNGTDVCSYPADWVIS
jgi:hypothetical protein